MIKIEKVPEKNRIILHIFKMKIYFKDSLRYYLLSPLVQILKLFSNFYFFIRRLNIKKNYKIISLGTYCFSRVITTVNKLKPRRCKGEKTCPFDLASFSDFNSIINLVDTNFLNFYNDLDKDEQKRWCNKNIGVIFPHDNELSKEQFIERYNKRIENLYGYFKDENTHKFILISSSSFIEIYQIEELICVLKKYMKKEDFDIILINQSDKFNKYKGENVYVINQDKNVEEFNYIAERDWVSAIFKLTEIEALKIYIEVTNSLINIISNVMNKKCSC